MPCPFLDECYEQTFRKCWNLCYYNKISEMDNYDSYGSGISGIVNYLRQHHNLRDEDILLKTDNTLLLKNGELYVYTPNMDEIVTAVETFNKIGTRFKYELARLIDYLIQFYPSSMSSTDALQLLQKLQLTDIEIYYLPRVFKEVWDKDPLEIEETAKKLLSEGYVFGGKLYTLVLALKVASMLNTDKFVRTLSESVGMALTIAHDAALMMKYNKNWVPGEQGELLKLVENLPPENNYRRLAIFVAKYLQHAEELGDYMDDADYDNINAFVGGDKASIKLGAHHAYIYTKNHHYIVEYHDHNARRYRAVMSFFKRVGFKVDDDSGIIEVSEERVEDAAKILAATTSVDIQHITWIFEEAKTIDELLRLRKEAEPEDNDEEDNDWD